MQQFFKNVEKKETYQLNVMNILNILVYDVPLNYFPYINILMFILSYEF